MPCQMFAALHMLGDHKVTELRLIAPWKVAGLSNASSATDSMHCRISYLVADSMTSYCHLPWICFMHTEHNPTEKRM